jgi:hypothetical protein
MLHALLVLSVSCVDGSGEGGGSPSSDAATDSEVDAGFTPSPMPPIAGTANSEFQAAPVSIELNQGFLKLLAPGDVGIEERTFAEPMYLLVLGNMPIGCEQPHVQLSSSVKVTMYFDPSQPLPVVGLYPEVRFVDRHPTQAHNFSVNSSSGDISGMLNEVSGDMASGTVESTGAARTEFSGTFEVRVCP